MSSSEMSIEQARAKLGDLVIAAMNGQTTTLTRYGRPVARIVPIEEPTMTDTTYYVMNSDGSEEPGSGPAWIVVDEEDAMLASAPYEDGDEITDGIRRLVEAGALPAGAEVVEETRLYSPYSWQIDPYRWTLAEGAADGPETRHMAYATIATVPSGADTGICVVTGVLEDGVWHEDSPWAATSDDLPETWGQDPEDPQDLDVDAADAELARLGYARTGVWTRSGQQWATDAEPIA